MYRVVVGLSLLIILSACTQHIHIPYAERSAGKLMRVTYEAQHERFDYVQQDFALSNVAHSIKRRQVRGSRVNWVDNDVMGPHRVRMLEFPSYADNGQIDNLVRVRYYQSREPGAKKLIIVLPIYGSYKYPSEQIAAGLRARNGEDANIAVFLAEKHLLDFARLSEVKTEAEFMQTAFAMRERIITSVIDVRRFIDWAESQPEIDANRIGLAGFSMSALTAGLLGMVEPRLAGTVVVMGAGRPYDVLAVCPGRPKQARLATLNKFNWSVNDYRQRMYEVFADISPENIQFSTASPQSILMIDAAHDDCMPKQARDALWEALGNPERISYLYSHKKAFLAMTPLGLNTMRREIYRFLDERLAPSTIQAAIAPRD